MTIQIEKMKKKDKEAVRDIVRSYWGDETIIVNKEVINTSKLVGLKTVKANEIIGILHYRVAGDECQIITLASTKQGQGVGSKLLQEVEEIARKEDCQLISLNTTNDNLHALGFYQRRGFHLAGLYPGEVTAARKLKPTIPEIGENNIPIRDEIRLEKNLE